MAEGLDDRVLLQGFETVPRAAEETADRNALGGGFQGAGDGAVGLADGRVSDRSHVVGFAIVGEFGGKPVHGPQGHPRPALENGAEDFLVDPFELILAQSLQELGHLAGKTASPFTLIPFESVTELGHDLGSLFVEVVGFARILVQVIELAFRIGRLGGNTGETA